MNNKGFVSTGVVLSLFILCLFLLMSLLSIYSNNRRLLSKQIQDVKDNLDLDFFIDNNIIKTDVGNYYLLSYNNHELLMVSIDYLNINEKNIDEWWESNFVMYNGSYKILNQNELGIKVQIKLNNISMVGTGTFNDPYQIVEVENEIK